MFITLTYYTQIYLEDTQASKKQCKEICYDLTKEDVDEFVKTKGFDNCIEYFEKNLPFEGEELEDEMKYVRARYKNGKYNYLDVYFGETDDYAELEQFIIKKHQNELIQQLFD